MRHSLVFLAVLTLVAGCNNKSVDPLVVVTLDASSPIADIDHVHITASVGASTLEHDFSSGAPFSLPPAKTFGLDVAVASSGTLTIAAVAFDKSGARLATGGGTVQLAAGARRDVTVQLTAGVRCAPTACQAAGLLCGATSDGCDCTPCQLTAINAPLGISGSSVTLEGKFDSSTTVNFPGGASVAATVPAGGGNRATVVVPAGATSGGLTITSGGITTPALPFRRPPFALGLGSFAPQYDQAACARQTPTLRKPRGGHSALVAGNWLFVVGGFNSGALSTVERAMINADGTLGGFVADGTTSLQTASNAHASVVLGNWLYVLGGSNGSALMRVERAPILPSGLLGPFADAPTALTTARSGATATIVGDYLYLIGGSNGGGWLTSVERAPIAADGTLGSFSDAGVALKTARSLHGATVIGNRLYVAGGFASASTYLDRVESATIASDGTIGAFDDAGVSLMTARGSHQLQVIGSTVYVFGGTNGTPVTTVESASINPDGSLQPFANVSAGAPARVDAASVVVGNYVYEIGGSGGPPSASVDRANINVSGLLSNFDYTAGKLVGTSQPSPVVVGNTLYLFEGSKSQHAPINADGTLGPFTADAGFPGGYPAVVGNYVFVYSAKQSQRAPINDDGTLGAFANVAVSGKTTVGGFRFLALGNGLYSVGGFNVDATTPASAAVEMAPIDAMGNLGAFTTTNVPPLAIDSERGGAVVLGNNAFAYLGFSSSTGGTTPSTERSAFDATTLAPGTWSGVSATPGSAYDPCSLVIGPKLWALGYSGGNLGVLQASIGDATLALAKAAQQPTVKLPVRSGAASLVTNDHAYLIGGYDRTGAPYPELDTVEQATLQ